MRDDVSNEMKSVDFGRVEWKTSDRENLEKVHTAADDNNPSSDMAKQAELHKLHQFETYDEIEDNGQKTISTRWVITSKDGNRTARLVARGFE